MSSTAGMAKDPICGMVVPTATALSAQRAGRSYYFCSQGCRQTFLAPEQQLRRMRRRVGIALGGVLALAVLRAAAFIALAAGISLLSWAPVAQLPWLTWGVWLFLLGTSVAYLYSVVVVFAPQLLPVGIDERDVYFEVSAVVIAFVLMGKTMEESIKQRSSAAVRRLLDLQPATATVIRDGQEMVVPAEAVQRGDLVLLGNDLRDVVTAIGLSRVTMCKIRQNLFWAFIYNSLGVSIAALGWLNPMIAGAAMALSSLSVIVNSTLLRNYRTVVA